MGIIKRLKWKDKTGKTTDYDLGAKASNVEQDATHRFVSDTEKQTWNGKADPEDIPSGSAADYGVANNDTTNRTDMLVTAQVAYQHGREIDQLNSDFQDWFGVTEDGQRGWKEQGADTVYPFLKTVEIAGSVSLEKVGMPNDDRAYARIDAPDGFEISQIIYSSSGFSTDMYYNFNVGGTTIGNQEHSNVTNRKLDISSAQDRSFLQVLIRQYGEHASGTGSVNYTIQFERKAG